MSKVAYPFGLVDPRSPESEISSVDASLERGGSGVCIM